MPLKILLPVYDNGSDQFDRIFKEIRKAGMEYSLLMEADTFRRGELPARNSLFKKALQDDDWGACITLSNDIFELPQNWVKDLVDHLLELPTNVGALNAYGFVNTFAGYKWAQSEIDENGANTGKIYVPETVFGENEPTPPNPELSTALCIIRREVLEKVGLFDEGFGRGGGMEHWDYVIRMYQAGYQNLLTYRVRFKADIAKGNNFVPNDTYTYYHRKWGTGFDGLPTNVFIQKAKTTSPSVRVK